MTERKFYEEQDPNAIYDEPSETDLRLAAQARAERLAEAQSEDRAQDRREDAERRHDMFRRLAAEDR